MPRQNELKQLFEKYFWLKWLNDNDSKISYKQWEVNGTTTLICIKSTVDEFIQSAIEIINEMHIILI